MATAPLPASCFVTDLDGGVIILPADDAAEITRRRDRVAKRARDRGLLLREEGDASGWSSAVLERALALRRRRGPASSSRRGCGLVVGTATAAAADEHKSATSGVLAAEALAEGTALDDSYLSFFYVSVL